jgi:Na+/H+ antiporter NhaD/arsenite permease-like protein
MVMLVARLVKIIIVFLVLLLASTTLMSLSKISNDAVGLAIASSWCIERGINTSAARCLDLLNSSKLSFIQGFALALFLFTIALTVIKMEWRVAAAMLAIAVLIIIDASPPQYVLSSVQWNLILFLVGTMTLAGLLREIGVFRFLAIGVLRVSRGSAFKLILLIVILAYALAAALDEVTSIVYVAMLVLELARILQVDVVPLLILSVLATNTGSSALPIGNPIGVYLLFRTNMSISLFIRNSLPLSLLNLAVLILVFSILERIYIGELNGSIKEHQDRINKYLTRYLVEVEVEDARMRRIRFGLSVLSVFIITVALNDYIVEFLSRLAGSEVDPHAFLSFIPYVFILLLTLVVPMEEVSRLVEKSVEWSSILFFVFLFMLSHMLTYTGAMSKLAYLITRLASTSSIILVAAMLFTSAGLSSVLDNLSLVVTLTPVAILLNQLGIARISLYFALLFGGVFGGNYTPVGSTANIVAVGLAEKRKIRITWSSWLKLALVSTTIQILVALLYLYFL